MVPCFIEGAFACWPPSRKWPRPGKLRLRIGAPLRFDDVANDAAGRARITAACKEAVEALR